MAGRDIIVVGGSAGGVDALARLVAGLPPGFPASLFVVCHFPTGGRSVLPEILSRSGPLLAAHAADDERFAPGHIYVAPPDRHLVLRPDGRMRLTREARENHSRPAADPLFRSAARFDEHAQQAARYGSLIARHVLHSDPSGDSGPDAPAQDSTPWGARRWTRTT